MATVLVTGSSGLIGSETVKFFHEKGFDVVGIDNNMRKYFFGEDGSTDWNTKQLTGSLPALPSSTPTSVTRRRSSRSSRTCARTSSWSCTRPRNPVTTGRRKEPFTTDFTVNANGTLVMLEATFRQFCPEAAFIFTSTNKVYGDTPNRLPLVEEALRWEVHPDHPYATHGIDESMSIDQSKHSIFGASKVAADVMTQEYGRYFGLNTAVFRGGCLTGPAHSGAELHGFLAYLGQGARSRGGSRCTIFGYKGKQVRDNIHSSDLVNAFWHYFQAPHSGETYNIGGARHSNCSMLEAIQIVEEISGRKLQYRLSDDARSGDHIWWISDVRKFQAHYPQWAFKHDIRSILGSRIVEATRSRA